MQTRLFSFLFVLTALSVSAQDHPGDPTAKAASAPTPADARPAPSPGAVGGGGRGDTSSAVAEMRRFLADPAGLEKGRQLFEAHCVDCHGPGGLGSRGPTLAQPNLPRSGDDPTLVRIIQSGIPGTEMPRVMLQQGEAPYIAAYVRKLGQVPLEKVPGDPANGAELFQNKGACLNCHMRQGQGVPIGPDLSDIGQRRSAAFLRRSLTEPGAEIPQSFDPYRAEISLPKNFMFIRARTKDGRDVAGIRVNENTYSIQLRDLTGELHSYYKKELTELHKDRGVSPMPAYSGVFTPAELDDVVAYLVSLRGVKK